MLTNAAAWAEAYVSALHPLKTTLHIAAARILFQSELYPMGPMTNPHWLRVRFWCLTFYKALHDLSPWPLCLIPFHSLPPQPTQLQSLWACLLLSHTRHIFGSLCSRPPYHRACPWPSLPSFIPISLILHNTHHDLVQDFLLSLLCASLLGSVQFSHSVVSNSLQPHESQHARPPCSSPTLGVYSNSCPSSRWCHPAISSPVVPFSSCPQSLPGSGSFPMSQLFTWGGQVLGFQPQHQSFQWTPRTNLL